MSKPINSPELPVFTTRAPGLGRSILWGGLFSVVAGGLMLSDGSFESWVAVVPGVLIAGLHWFLAWSGSKDVHLVLYPDRFELWDKVLGTGKEWRGSTPWSNVEAVLEEPGRGVGFKLRRPERFFDSFELPPAAKHWAGLHGGLRRKHGADVWFAARHLEPDPQRFVTQCRLRLGVGPVPAAQEDPLSFMADSRSNLIRMVVILTVVMALITVLLLWLRASGKELGPGLAGGIGGGVAVLVLGLLNRFGNTRVQVFDDRLEISDAIGSNHFKSVVRLGDVESVVDVPGKGVGVKLLQLGPWLESFSDPKAGKEAWMAQQRKWRQGKGVDLWFPDYMLGKQPRSLAPALQWRLGAAAPATDSATAAADMDFEKLQLPAGRAVAASACVACGQALDQPYWELNEQLLCESCLGLAQAGRGERTGRWRRGLRAVFWGGLGGLAGAAVFAGVAIASGYELGLISLLMGYWVGVGVKKGSRGRGGWVYQLLALSLAYGSITVAYGSVVAQAMWKARSEAAVARPADPAEASGPAAETTAATEGAATAAAEEPAAGPDGGAEKKPEPDAEEAALPWYLRLLAQAEKQNNPFVIVGIGLAIMLGGLLALPFIIGMESPISLVIVGIALWEAWRRNQAEPFVVKGPFQPAPKAEA